MPKVEAAIHDRVLAHLDLREVAEGAAGDCDNIDHSQLAWSKGGSIAEPNAMHAMLRSRMRHPSPPAK